MKTFSLMPTRMLTKCKQITQYDCLTSELGCKLV